VRSKLLRVGAVASMMTAVAVALGGCASPDASSSSVVTFKVAGQETYSIELTTPELVEHVKALMKGSEDGRIPNGKIVRTGDGGVNSPWTWHIDPKSLEFVDFTTEVCDGLPSYVEDQTLTSDRYCPWNAEVVDLQPLKASQ
jgi:hypothetical protein